MKYKVEGFGRYLETYNQEYIEPGKGIDADGLTKEYLEGAPAHYLLDKYDMSAGQMYSHLSANKVLRRANSKKLIDKLAKYTAEEISQIITEYINGVSNEYIYTKHGLHKNGLYYLLDVAQVPRKNSKFKKEEG